VSCLFCRREDGGFTSREHALPESMGNTELILPPGVVCDRCNNGPLSQLDQALCEFGPIAMRRTMLGVSNKQGTIPVFRSHDGRIEHVRGVDGADPTLIFQGADGRSMIREERHHPDGRIELSMGGKLGGRPLTPRYTAMLQAALLKTALELAWIDHQERVFHSDFDQVRDAVLGAPRDGYVTMANRVDPNEMQTTVHYWLDPAGDNPNRIVVIANYAGIILCTDSCSAAPLGGDKPGLQTRTFTKADFPSGSHL
jgi:hypothetical protein